MADGIDYSWARPGGRTIKEHGKVFAVRYLYADGQGGKGLDRDELADLQANGIEVPVVFESWARRPLDGREAGKADATASQAQLVDLGLPPSMPIYFAVDWDATPEEQAAIDNYLRGCADVIGVNRVGVYAGYHIVKRCSENGTAKWFWQTYAWSGGNWFPGNHIEQWLNGQTLAGAVDLDRSKQDNYGQPSKFGGSVPVPVPPTPTPPAGNTTYTAQSGDNMSSIAAKHGMTLSQLIALNPNAGHPPGNYNLIYAGDVFVVKGSAPAPGPQPQYYTVKSGDNLSTIAMAHGTTTNQLVQWNRAKYPSLVTNPNLIYPGWVLRVK